MSLTRTAPDSPREITDPKRRSFDKDLSFFSSIPPLEPLPVGILSPIDLLVDVLSIKRLAEKLVISDELVKKAIAAKQILEDGISNSDQGVEKLSNVVLEFWLNQCFINSLRTIMESEDLVSLVVKYANQDPAHQRWKLMKEDPLLKPYLTSLDSPAATNSDIMRLFLSILIGYWSDKDLLTKLDDTMGKVYFGRWLNIVARQREKLAREKPKYKLYVEKREIKNFIYFIKDADDSKKKLKLVQQWLVSTYGKEKSVNMDALLKEIQSKLSRQLEISWFYDGKKAKIQIQVVDGLYAFVNMDPMCNV